MVESYHNPNVTLTPRCHITIASSPTHRLLSLNLVEIEIWLFIWNSHPNHIILITVDQMPYTPKEYTKNSDILILQDKTIFCAFETCDFVCWLVNPPIPRLSLYKSADCRWVYETYLEYCYGNSVRVRRRIQSPIFQSTIFCGYLRDLCGKGIQVLPLEYILLQHSLSWLERGTKWSRLYESKLHHVREVMLTVVKTIWLVPLFAVHIWNFVLTVIYTTLWILLLFGLMRYSLFDISLNNICEYNLNDLHILYFCLLLNKV